MLHNTRNPIEARYFGVFEGGASYFNTDTVRNNNPLEGIEYDGIYPGGTLLKDLGGRCEVLHNGCIKLVARVIESRNYLENEVRYVVIR
jgi:hypothetical protein